MAPTAAATPSPTAAPTPSPTAAPTLAPTPSPSPTQAALVDPTEDLEIAAPYEFEPLDANTAAQLSAGLEASLGAMAAFMEIGARQVNQGGQPVGFILGFRFVNVPGGDDPAVFEQLMAGVTASAGGEVRAETVDGVEVNVIEAQGATFAAHQQGDLFVFTYGNTAEGSLAIVEALLAAR